MIDISMITFTIDVNFDNKDLLSIYSFTLNIHFYDLYKFNNNKKKM